MAYSREMEKLERQFAENPRRFAAPFADALRKSDDVERALEVIRVGLELNPDYIPGSVILGRCHLDLGDDNSAEAAFSRVLDLDNENVIALKSLADIMERQGRNDEAISFLTYLLDVDRSNDEAREQLARIRSLPDAAAQPAQAASPATATEEPPPASADPGPAFGAPLGEAEEIPTPAEEFLEPTALWEPPVEVAEASISSWVETTSAEAIEPPSLGESLLDEPPTVTDVPPVEGFESAELDPDREPAPFDDFVLEREEEIVLTSMSGAEYQVANDSEALLERTLSDSTEEPREPPVAASRPPAPPQDLEPEPEPEPEQNSANAEAPAEQEFAAAAPAPDFEVPVEEVAEDPVTMAEARVEEVAAAGSGDDVASGSALEEESPLEWAMHVGEEREFHPGEPTHTGAHAPDSFDDAIEGIAPVDEVVADEESDADVAVNAEAEEGADDEPPVLMVTESMAELYAGQGHPGEALGVYRILYDRNPDNERLRARIQELESVMAAKVLEDAAPSYAASVTGGQPVASFLGAMLGARPAAVELPEPPAAPELPAAGADGSDEGEEAVASGAPTRPAIDRLSLGAIFGEDPSPVPPAENNPAGDKAEGSAGFSFDEFFGGGESVPSGRTSSGSVRATRASDDEDDLDQFHSWLQSLKR